MRKPYEKISCEVGGVVYTFQTVEDMEKFKNGYMLERMKFFDTFQKIFEMPVEANFLSDILYYFSIQPKIYRPVISMKMEGK